jgi:hypothetical protein
MTKTAIASFESPRRMHFFPEYREVEMISARQKSTLTSLIYQNITEENERENLISQLEDMTSKDAARAIFEFEMGRW